MRLNIAIKPSDLRTRAIPSAPNTFNGLRSGYIAQCLAPVLPDLCEVDRLHHLLAQYVQSHSALLLVRHVTGMVRGRVYQTRAGALLKATDNAPAWWWHSVLFNRVRVGSDTLRCFIEATPCHFHQTGKWATINQSRWHAAHIFDVKDGDTNWAGWSRESAVRRFIRNIHPCNVFFVPTIEWQRLGADLGLIGAVAVHYRRRYASVWAEFIRLAQGELRFGDGEVDGPLVIGGSPKPTPAQILAGTPTPANATTPRDALWREIFSSATPLKAAQVLAAHPDAAAPTARLVAHPTARRIVAIANAMYNPCRPEYLSAVGQAASEEAWAILLSRRDTPYTRTGTQWERLAAALHPIPDWAASRLRNMDIVALGSVAQALIRGPYRRI